MRRQKLTAIEATPWAQEQWVAHVAEIVGATLMPQTNRGTWEHNISGKPPHLCPEGVGGYRKKCAEIAEGDYEGFVFDGV